MANNISDRGGAGPSADVLAQLHREDLERHARGEPPPFPEIGDVRQLDSERIAELGEKYGRERAAAAIAAAAAVQLANIKLEVDCLPKGERLMRVGDDSHLSQDDVDFLNTRRLQRAKAEHIARSLRDDAIDGFIGQIVEACSGDEAEADRIARKIGRAALARLIGVRPRSEQRKRLRDLIEGASR